MRTSSTVLAALRVVVVALLGAGAGSALAAPEIVLVPDSGAPGDTVGISGTGFPPFSSILVGFSQDGVDQVVGFTGADDVGSFTAGVVVPEDAAIGPALFFAGNTLASAEADFFVTGSEPTGDPKGPPADKVAVCEVVYILERVRNGVFSTDEDFVFEHPARRLKSLELEAKHRELTRVAEEIGRERLPKDSFPIKRTIALQLFVARPENRFLSAAVSAKPKTVDCPGSLLFEFTHEKETVIELKDQFGAKLGSMEATYRVIVREANAE